MVNKSDYIGTVIYTDDPAKSGRCKVRVFGLFDDLPDENIPWFAPMTMNIFSGSGGGNISIPKNGDIVRVRFNDDSPYSGEYTSLQIMDPALIEKIKEDYQGTHVLLYDSTKDLLVVYQPRSGLKFFLNGSYVKIDANGSIEARHMNNKNSIEIGDRYINIKAEDNSEINISTKGTVNVTAPTVNVNSNEIQLGNNASSRAVRGDKLIEALREIVMALNAKYPLGTVTPAIHTFENILSNSVKIS